MTTHQSNEVNEAALTEWHKRSLTEERVPCGICQTFEFWDKEGNLLRRDVKILVDKIDFIHTETGKVG